MLEVKLDERKVIAPDEVFEEFEQGSIVVATNGAEIGKLNVIGSVNGIKEYAFVNLSGSRWLNGKAASVTALVEEYLQFKKNKVLVFEEGLEYGKWVVDNA
jgi:hypothetical protein